MPITADAATRIIDINIAPTNGVVEVDVPKELYSKLKDDWHSDASLQKVKFPFRTFGDSIGAETIGPFVFIDNTSGWRVRPHDSDHDLVLKGNLIPESAVQGATTPLYLDRTGRTISISAERSAQALTSTADIAAFWNHLIEGAFTAEEIIRIMAAVLAGKASGAPNSTVFRDLGDTKNRVSTTTDNFGNRSSITLDKT